MNINSDAMLSVSEANRNFSLVTKMVDKFGQAVILKNNAPKYVVLDFSSFDNKETIDDDVLIAISEKFMKIFIASVRLCYYQKTSLCLNVRGIYAILQS